MWRSLGRFTGRPLAEGRKVRHASQADQMWWALIIDLGRPVVPEVWKDGYGVVFGELPGLVQG
jgi:hypothetical protein